MKLLSILCFPLVLLLTKTTSYCEADRQRVPRRLVMAGGYSPVEELDDDEQIHAAAVMAVQTLRVGGAASYSFIPNLPTQLDAASDVRIIRAFSQVVAGLNYRLILAVTPASDAGACLGAFAVEIYNHFGDLSVTTWGQEIDCTTAMAALQNPDLLNSPLGKEFHGRK